MIIAEEGQCLLKGLTECIIHLTQMVRENETIAMVHGFDLLFIFNWYMYIYMYMYMYHFSSDNASIESFGQMEFGDQSSGLSV